MAAIQSVRYARISRGPVQRWTEYKGKKLVEPYIDKMEIGYKGTIRRIAATPSGARISVGFERAPGTPFVQCFFDPKEWGDQLSALHHGDIIEVIGTIDKLTAMVLP